MLSAKNSERKSYYISSCVFTARNPELSFKIQEYITSRFHYPILRCCTPKYKLKKYEALMPDELRKRWCSLNDCESFSPGDTVYSICNNCLAVIEESQPEVTVKSIWELILEDKSFPYPDYKNREMTIQDCWRAHDRREEQYAVREILKRMNINVVELLDNLDNTDFCGTSLYEPNVPRNAKMAPRRYVENAQGKFIPRSPEEQKQLMKEYCKKFRTKEVVTYCHYCQSGLELGEMQTYHLASLLFAPSAYLKQ